MINKKTVDIVVPVYNQSSVIDNFLNSAILIDCAFINVIFINDGSTDGSEHKISEFIEVNRLDNFLLINKKNSGVSAARNTGLMHVVSDYVWFCDPDDIILGDLHDIKTIISQEKDTDVFVFSYETFNVSTLSSKVNERKRKSVDGRTFIIENNKLSNEYWYPASDGTLWDKIYKKSSISNIYFDEGLICSEDFNFNLKVLKQVNKVTISNNIIYRYYVYPKGTLSSTFSDKVFDNRIKAERDTILFLKDNCLPVREEVKKHIEKNSHLLSIHSDLNPFSFYLNEHKLLGENIYPFSSQKEFIFFMLSTVRLYMPLIRLYRKTKKIFLPK